LQPTIQAQAIQKLDKGNVITNTIGSGGATNSVTVKLCNGKPCGK
jgi:filamentous hemagglutinin